MDEPDKESRTSGALDIDRFLETNSVCRLGTSPDNDATAGTFRESSKVFATLGRKMGHTETRTVFFGTSGQVTVIESMQTLDSSRNLVLGRDDVGGSAVSATHARISTESGRYVTEDLGSTNGTDVFKATEITLEQEEYSSNVAFFKKEQSFSRALIGIGNTSVISLLRLPSGEYAVLDATASRKTHAQMLRTIEEGQAITIGKKDQTSPSHLSGEKLELPEKDIEVSHLRIFIKDGDIYVVNLAGKQFSVAVNGIPQHAESKMPPPKPGPREKAKPKQPKRVPTARLWLLLEDEIHSLEQAERDPNKLFRQLARKYHPDLNRDDPDANRKMQFINKYFDK